MDLSHRNTLGVPCRASRVHRIACNEDLQELAPALRGSRFLVLAGGSNVLLPEVIEMPVCLMESRGIRVHVRGDRAEVTVAAGEDWHALVRWSLDRDLYGIENLSLIPGSVGAAPVQNIGAYGVQLAERLLWVTALEVDSGRLQRLERDDCAFAYRDSLFKAEPGRFIITDVTLALHTKPHEVNVSYPDVRDELKRMGRKRAQPGDVADAVMRIRRRKLPDPGRIPNAGSFFRNPVVDEAVRERIARRLPDLKSYPDPGGCKLAAAQLIGQCMVDDAGRVPGWASADAPVRVWARQPLVLTNPGRRPGKEVLYVAEQIRSAVAGRFGVRLELEPDAFLA